MSKGKLSVIGLGPGSHDMLTQQAQQALSEADQLYGYEPYLARLEKKAWQQHFPSDNRVEAERAKAALDAACKGGKVAMVSGGDPGVFAMAAAVCEQVEAGSSEYRALDIQVIPGITAMLAAAAACGAPLGNDFCAISLSNNLKPWPLIEHRLRMAAKAGFAMAFYNPISRARPWQLEQAYQILREELPESTPVILARAISRPDEQIRVTNLGDVQASWADMATMVIIGSENTRIIEREEKPPLVYTPRKV